MIDMRSVVRLLQYTFLQFSGQGIFRVLLRKWKKKDGCSCKSRLRYFGQCFIIYPWQKHPCLVNLNSPLDGFSLFGYLFTGNFPEDLVAFGFRSIFDPQIHSNVDSEVGPLLIRLVYPQILWICGRKRERGIDMTKYS